MRKCNQSRLGFELVLPCPFPTTITITPRAPPVEYSDYCPHLCCHMYHISTDLLSAFCRRFSFNSKIFWSNSRDFIILIIKFHLKKILTNNSTPYFLCSHDISPDTFSGLLRVYFCSSVRKEVLVLVSSFSSSKFWEWFHTKKTHFILFCKYINRP